MEAERVELAGLPFASMTELEVVDAIIDAHRNGRGGRVVTPNVDFLHKIEGRPDLRELIRQADLIVADGAPVVWALRLQGTPVPERVAGSALGPRLMEAAARAGVGVFLLGGNPGTAERAAAQLATAHPDLRIGWHFPPFGFEAKDGELVRITRALDAFGPCICLVGLGFPKQDVLGDQLLARYPGSWFIGAGATIDFIAGDFSRAPVWMQRMGLEWVHRLILEPRRLARRYVAQDLPFALKLLAVALLRRLPRSWS